MTQFSFPWSALSAGDGGTNSYDLNVVEDTNKFLQNINPDTDGVIWWTQSPYANLLEPTNPAGSTVRIASGLGIVEGWLYSNDTNVDFNINASPGNANATDIIVLQRVLASQTVRLARIGGAAGTKAVLTQTAATWEIPIVDVVLDGAGNFSSLVDARKLALPPGTVIKLDEVVSPGGLTVTFSSIPPIFTNLHIKGRARALTAFALATRVNVRFNDIVSSTDYDYIRTENQNTPATATSSATGQTLMEIMSITSIDGTANYFDAFTIVIPNYSQVTGYKKALTKFSAFGNSTPFAVGQGSGWWKKQVIVNSVILSVPADGWATGSKVTLYGEV